VINFGVDPDVDLGSVFHLRWHWKIGILRYIVTHQRAPLQQPQQI